MAYSIELPSENLETEDGDEGIISKIAFFKPIYTTTVLHQQTFSLIIQCIPPELKPPKSLTV